MAAQMEVNQASENSISGHSAGGTPNDGTGMTLELRRISEAGTKLCQCRCPRVRPISRTIQGRAQITIQQDTELDQSHQRNRRRVGEVQQSTLVP